MATPLDIREIRPDEADAAAALLGEGNAHAMTIVASDGETLLAACRCDMRGKAGCDAAFTVADSADEDASWQLFNQTVGKVIAAGAHRCRVDGGEQIDALWQRAQWGDQQNLDDAACVYRVMGRR